MFIKGIWQGSGFTRGSKNNKYKSNVVINYADKEMPDTCIMRHNYYEGFGSSVYYKPHTDMTPGIKLA